MKQKIILGLNQIYDLKKKCLRKGVDNFLKRQSKEHEIIICTENETKFIREILTKFNINCYINEIITLNELRIKMGK